MDIGTCFVEQGSKRIWTSFCFVPPEKRDTASKKGTPQKKNAITFHGEEGSDNHESRHGRCVQTHPPAIDGISSVHQPTFKIFCKSESDEGCCLALRDGTLVPADSRDEHQHWFRDTRLSIAMKDEEGNPVFSLVNKATNLAIKHSLGMNHPVTFPMLFLLLLRLLSICSCSLSQWRMQIGMKCLGPLISGEAGEVQPGQL